jgi:FkbM family methyltransferase
MKIIKRLINRILGGIPITFLARIEVKVQSLQGKGSGSESIESEVRLALKLLNIEKTDSVVALDIGANIGNWTASILKNAPLSRIFLFEPSKSAYEKLKIRFSNLDQATTINNYALGSELKEALLFTDEFGSGLASLTKRKLDHFGISFEKSENVRVQTLNSWYEKFKVMPSIIKVDVEGNELDVLKGASDFLKDVRVIQFEFGGSNIDSRTFFQDYWYFFKEKDFDLLRLAGGKLIEIKEYKEQDETFRVTNYFAVNRKK